MRRNTSRNLVGGGRIPVALPADLVRSFEGRVFLTEKHIRCLKVQGAYRRKPENTCDFDVRCREKSRKHLLTELFSLCRVGPGNFTLSLSQIRT
jgi:hypothetical protein